MQIARSLYTRKFTFSTVNFPIFSVNSNLFYSRLLVRNAQRLQATLRRIDTYDRIASAISDEDRQHPRLVQLTGAVNHRIIEKDMEPE